MGTVLSSRERLTRLFNGQDIDRIPIWLLAPYHRLGCYADIYNLECYKLIVDAIDKYCDTFDRRHFNTGFCYNGNPEIKWEHSEQDNAGNHIAKDILRYKDMSFTKYVSTGKDGTKLKPLIEDVGELEKIMDIPYIPSSPDVSNFFREQEELGDKGFKILSFLDAIYDRVLYAYKYLLDRNVGDVFFIVGAEFAGPPLVSPTKFRDLSVRYVKGIVDLIREYGKKSIVHYHGNLYKVLSGIKEINPDGLHTIEAPPIGDCTITQAREALGRDMVLIGNIQYDDLVRKDKDEIEQMVKDAIEEGKSGRFILSPTAGPYETFINEKTVENYLAFINAGIKYGNLEG